MAQFFPATRKKGNEKAPFLARRQAEQRRPLRPLKGLREEINQKERILPRSPFVSDSRVKWVFLDCFGVSPCIKNQRKVAGLREVRNEGKATNSVETRT